MPERLLASTRNATIAVFVAALAFGLLLPVYTDEIGWRFQERAGIDGVDKMFSELCGPNTLAAPAFFMWPVRWYSALFNTAFPSPLWVRLSGIGYALGWLALVLLLVRRLVPERWDRLAMATVGAGLMALGLSPLLAVWSRPEQPTVLAATAALFIAMADGPRPTGETAAATAWRRSAVLAALAAIALSYHLKGLFVVPLILACLVFASRGRSAHGPRIAAALAIVACSGMAAAYWKARLSCPANDVLAAEYARNSLSAALAEVRSLPQALDGVRAVISNVAVFEYISQVTPRPWSLSNWLPRNQIGMDASFLWFLLIVAAWGLAFAVAVVSLLLAGWSGFRERRVDPRPVLALVLVATVLAWSGTQLIRNVYEATFVLPLLALAVIVALSARAMRWQRPVHAVLAGLVGIAGMGSAIALAVVFGPALARASAQSGYIEGQHVSVSAFGYERTRQEALAAARLCGIDPVRSRAVMVDDVTYFPFMQSRLPQHQLGVLGVWSGGTDPAAYLAGRRSSGAVVRCGLLPPALRAKARQSGRICCLGSFR